MKLTSEQAEWYAAMDVLFASKGWTFLLQGWKREHEALSTNTFFNAQSMSDVEEARVRYRLLDELITLPESIAEQQKAILASVPEDEEKNIYE